jgi:hypothetical protein
MFCPRCGQEQISDETRFCSRCGFSMTGVAALISNNGELPQGLTTSGGKMETPRKKGLKQGGMLFLSGFIIVPLITMFAIAVKAGPFIPTIAALLTFWGGILRMIYARVFESNDPNDQTLEEKVVGTTQHLLNKKRDHGALPQQSIPTSAYVPPVAGNWRDTNDLQNPPSVTEDTTKLLQKEKDL